ncbi:hypothetical protein N7534_000862 [Penicillium rubens]|jgi:hypothetical protein|nr:hypothetical protein N7534_000862 [Penicillium rubens]
MIAATFGLGPGVRRMLWDKIIVGEDNRHVAVDFNPAGILELANGICTLKWPSKIWVELEENLR